MRLKDIGFLYSGLSGKAGEDFQCDDLECTKPYIPFTNVLNNTKIDFNQFKRVVWTNGEIQNKVKENDIIFLMSSEDYESIAKAAVVVGNPGEVYLNSFCKGFRFKNLKSVCPEYVNYQLLTDKHRDALRFEARGFTRINIKMDRIESAAITLPPIDEQRKIVSYLDAKTSAIDAQVSLLEQKAKKYEQLKKSLISHVVTRGLNKDVYLKDSDIEWLGQIPEHWEVRPFKTITLRMSTGLNPRDNFKLNDGVCNKYYVTIRNFKNGNLYLDDNCDRINQQAWNIIQQRSDLRKGDVLLASISDTPQALIIREDPENWNINESVFSVRFNRHLINSKYFYYLYNSHYYERLRGEATGSTFTSIKKEMLDTSMIPLPPLSEQQAIAAYLDEKCAKIDSIIANIDKQIEKYKLLRRALINEVVTGQRAV